MCEPRCSRCGQSRDRPGQRYCRRCQREYQRERHRRGIENYASLAPEAKRKARVRALANAAIRKGELQRRPCEVCGTTVDVQKHHPDYDRPLDVVWLCGPHHRDRERQEAEDDGARVKRETLLAA